MADTGATLPGLGSNEDRDGKVDWSNPTNIQTEANTASCTIGRYDYGDWLRASQFGFSIPSGATIDGIQVDINRTQGSTGICDSSLRLVDADGNNVGDDKASATSWPGSAGTATYGGATDKWNASPTPAMVNDADFGVRLSAENTYRLTPTAYVNWIKITVYYTEAAVAHQASAFFPFM